MHANKYDTSKYGASENGVHDHVVSFFEGKSMFNTWLDEQKRGATHATGVVVPDRTRNPGFDATTHHHVASTAS